MISIQANGRISRKMHITCRRFLCIVFVFFGHYIVFCQQVAALSAIHANQDCEVSLAKLAGYEILFQHSYRINHSAWEQIQTCKAIISRKVQLCQAHTGRLGEQQLSIVKYYLNPTCIIITNLFIIFCTLLIIMKQQIQISYKILAMVKSCLFS